MCELEWFRYQSEKENDLKTDSRQDAKNKKMGLNFDEIITEVGGRGKYQMIRYSVLGCIPIAMSWHLVGNTLITAAPAHTCVPPSFETPTDNHLIADYVSTCSLNQKPAFSASAMYCRRSWQYLAQSDELLGQWCIRSRYVRWCTKKQKNSSS